MEATTLSAASVYVGTYAKYNNGSLFGAWLNLSDYSDKEEFYEACRELHKDEEDAEYMFQDWENVPEGSRPMRATTGPMAAGGRTMSIHLYPTL